MRGKVRRNKSRDDRGEERGDERGEERTLDVRSTGDVRLTCGLWSSDDGRWTCDGRAMDERWTSDGRAMDV